MSGTDTPSFDATASAAMMPYAALVDAMHDAALDYAAQRIVSPERLVVPLNAGGVMLSMPATAPDLAIHKLVNVCATNRTRDLPTIHGKVMAFDANTGETRFILDGPTVTGRRTAAISMLGVRTFAHVFADGVPREFVLIGTGTQASNHLDAIDALYPGATVHVKGSAPARAEAFCDAYASRVSRLNVRAFHGDGVPESADVVIALTTARSAVYDEAGRADRLVIGVGAFTPQMAEIGARTLADSAIFVDDKAGAKHEAGDLIQAGVAWDSVTAIADVLTGDAGSALALQTLKAASRPVVYKTVGCAAWDLAACRVVDAAICR
ncbi:bifunctional Delta(1)-pyrroline-2-carboxylate/Delta(1)-piperideine-2-carboxylate reductase [Paraburkholderia sp.]|uniref:bifunctional Delta(1)-pyrroline-2-carboxylate/Delta(1)-piperideine-2- carboxylate reductase n=1 Tax=Paraburkholderia sp. TaxID=1926495 RepID=UPI002384DB2A|nr:bifunctional Delta(1)-pyrroline-2-carboxylate/Delta(1)-piperideine-2-carboxylate reductase [Paraburkholderia sp.]MDE1182495.1 delta(1)-pyrroline-2-carboxylate reductase family protein [Paraburkholderia sp.]